MSTTTNAARDAALSLSIDGAEYACQVINAEFIPPSSGTGTTVRTACGGTVKEPGDPADGTISGEVFKDLSEGGITRALIEARESTVPYVYRETDAAGVSLTWTGDLFVPVFGVPFTPDKYGRHPLSLQVLTAEPAFTDAAG
jgi:hypothetical protein